MRYYLITCSGKKFQPTVQNKSDLSKLSFDDELGEFRRELIQRQNIQLDWNKTLPAYKLYTGRLYNKISRESWVISDDKILILSAMFGWIKPNDFIPYYDLSMNNHKIDNKLVYRFWLESNLLTDFVNSAEDIDLLTQPYRKAIHGNKNPVALVPDTKFRDNYGSHKGEWLNSRLAI